MNAELTVCRVCHGAGEIVIHDYDLQAGVHKKRVECPSCHPTTDERAHEEFVNFAKILHEKAEKLLGRRPN